MEIDLKTDSRKVKPEILLLRLEMLIVMVMITFLKQSKMEQRKSL